MCLYFVCASSEGSTRSRGCTNPFEPLLLSDVISTKFLCADTFRENLTTTSKRKNHIFLFVSVCHCGAWWWCSVSVILFAIMVSVLYNTSVKM